MTKAFGSVRLCLALLMIVAAFSSAKSQDDSCDTASSQECADAAKVGIGVQNALRDANATGLSGLSLKKAVLVLETGTTSTGGVNINFLIFTIKHQAKKGNTINQSITWGSLPKPAGAGGGQVDLKETLASAIATAAKVAASVTALPLTEATITVKFVIDKDNSGSISYKVLGVSIGPTVDLDKTSTNSLAVTFSK